MIKRLYPGGRPKAFNITYDDGVLQDIRFVEMMNRYGLKGTFNLNSQLMEQGFQWVHPSGLTISRLSCAQAADLYKGHEIASHSLTHPDFRNLDEQEITRQMLLDKQKLEDMTGTEVKGFAVPFDYYSPLTAYCASKCGFEYSRCSAESYSYQPPKNYLWWSAGAYHMNPRWREFAEGFFTTDTQLALCQIVGHAYDLDTENMWEEMENLLKRVSADRNIAPMTNLEMVRYLKAMDSAKITPKEIYNSTDTDLWFETDGEIVCVKAGHRLKLKK